MRKSKWKIEIIGERSAEVGFAGGGWGGFFADGGWMERDVGEREGEETVRERDVEEMQRLVGRGRW